MHEGVCDAHMPACMWRTDVDARNLDCSVLLFIEAGVTIMASVASQLAPGAPWLCFLNACLAGSYYACPALCGIFGS